MKKRTTSKLILILFVVILAVYLIYPLKGKIRLGLDLRGGTHLLLQVNTEDAINIETYEQISRLQELLKKKDIEFLSITKDRTSEFTILGINQDQTEKLKPILNELGSEWDIKNFGDKIIFLMKHSVANYLMDRSVDQALETIRNRIDEFGVAEPTIQRHGRFGDQIIVELPGIDNPERVKKIIKTTALLEWKLVKAGPVPNPDVLLGNYGGIIPDDMEITREELDQNETAYYLVSKISSITGKDLRNVRRSTDEWNNPAVAFILNPDGAHRFKRITSENIGKSLAIILDGKVQSAPVIEDVIYDSGIIRGTYSEKEAEDLALVLRAGALPASIKYLEERTIGPSLGFDSISKGLRACLAALFLVMLFMIAYYRSAGVNATAALAFNMVLLLAALSFFKATLTLPGIAGIILGVGMAVDANVLIFERIREELALAKSLAASVVAGFSRAFSAILDSNLTTIISAVFLFQFGTGPVKGYAVTLIIGILASMFTAVFVSHLIFDLTLLRRKKRTEQTRFLKTTFFKKTSINFMKYKFVAFGLSAVIIISGLLNMTVGKGLKYGVDFTGGTLIRLQFKDPISIEEIRKLLKNIRLGNSVIQGIGKGQNEYIIRTGLIPDDASLEQDQEAHEVIGSRIVDVLRGEGKELTVLSKETVGPQVGKSLRIKATQATVWALIGMLVYIALRFKLGFGVSAILTLTHDVLVTLSIYSFTNREINLPVIAAILTIVGFSLNDTIVIFDRVRDNSRATGDRNLINILNASVNQTLSRSIITSGTVFLTVITLFFFGGAVINDFAFAMLVGIISGSYSTIYQSCPIVYFWQKIFKTKYRF